MKRLNYFIVLCLGLLVLSSCSDWLELTPDNRVIADDALQTDADMRALMNSCYTVLGSDKYLGGRAQIFSDLLGDNVDGASLTGDFGSVYDRTTSIFGAFKNDFYAEPYIAVYRANVLLENLDVLSSDALRQQYEGEAKFIRAISHFDLVRFFGQPFGFTADNSHLGIPVRTSSTPSAGVRATVQEVYDQIITDLTEAAQLLPADNGVFANSAAAQGYLARVYFQMNRFDAAYTAATAAIQSSGATFNDDPAEFFGRFSANGTVEAVFNLVSSDINTNRTNGYKNEYRSDLNLPNLRLSQDILSIGTSDPNDARGAWYDNTTYAGNIVLTKFNGMDFFDNPTLHVTELLLTRAEAAAEQAEAGDNSNLAQAITDLNMILDRAYGGTRALAANASAALVKSTARYERRLELLGEGDRGHELKRIGALEGNLMVRGASWDCPGAVLQFPQGEIANSPGFVSNPEGGCQ